MPLGLMITSPRRRSMPLAFPLCIVTRPARKIPRFASQTSRLNCSRDAICNDSTGPAPNYLHGRCDLPPERLQALHHVTRPAAEIIVQRLILWKKPVVDLVMFAPGTVGKVLDVRHLFGCVENGVVPASLPPRSHGAMHSRSQRGAGLQALGQLDFAPRDIGVNLHQEMITLRKPAAGKEVFDRHALGLEGPDNLAGAKSRRLHERPVNFL